MALKHVLDLNASKDVRSKNLVLKPKTYQSTLEIQQPRKPRNEAACQKLTKSFKFNVTYILRCM